MDSGPGVRPEPVAVVMVSVLIVGGGLWFVGKASMGPASVLDLPTLGALSGEHLADCGPSVLSDHLFKTRAPGFIPDPKYQAHQREVLSSCIPTFVLWSRMAGAACSPPLLEFVDERLAARRPLVDALDALSTDNRFRRCYSSWMEQW